MAEDVFLMYVIIKFILNPKSDTEFDCKFVLINTIYKSNNVMRLTERTQTINYSLIIVLCNGI